MSAGAIELSPSMLNRVTETTHRFDDAARRRKIYAIVAIAFFAFGWIVTGGKAWKKYEAVDFVVSDAEGYYIYLPTVVLDGDLDFANQLAIHSTMHEVDPTATPQVGKTNRWPIGLALTLSPAFVVGHLIALGLHSSFNIQQFSPNGYSLPYQFLCSAGVALMGWWGMCMADGMIARELRLCGSSIFAGVLVYWIGTNYAYYFFREPLMAHVVSATWMIAAASICQRILATKADRRFVSWHWPALSAAMSMAVITRFTNASLCPLLFIVAVQTARAGFIGHVFKQVILIALGTAPLICQVLVWHSLTGHAMAGDLQQIGYRSQERFYWFDPAFFKTLVSSRHGLLFWSPVLIVSMAGIVWHLVRGGYRSAWLCGLTSSAILLWYLNSAWYAWGFGYSFGARAFVEMAGLFIAGFAIAFDGLTRVRPALRKAAWSTVALTIAYSYLMMALFILKVLPRDDFLIPRTGLKPPPGLDSYYRPYLPPRSEAE